MNLISLVAHSGDDHESSIESSKHLIDTAPIVAVLIALIVIFAIPYFLHRIKPKSIAPTIVLLFELFIVGVLSFEVLPALSIISISLGFLLALMFAFGGISQQ